MRNSGKIVRKLLAGAALLAAVASVQATSYNVANDYTGWLNSLQAIGSTTIGNGTFIGDPRNNTVPVVQGVPGLGFQLVGGGNVTYQVLSGMGTFQNTLVGGYLEWLFPSPQNGFGGTFLMSGPGNAGLSFKANDVIKGWIDVTDVVAGQGLNGFLGFTSTDQFTGVRVVEQNPGLQGSSYGMTDVSIGAATPAGVPDGGASLAMLLFTFAGIASYSRWQRKA